jgi:hypothetical protein
VLGTRGTWFLRDDLCAVRDVQVQIDEA